MIPGDKVKTKVAKFNIPAGIIGFVYDVYEDITNVVFDCLDESGVTENTLHYYYKKNELEVMYDRNTTWKPNTDRNSRPKEDCEAFVIVEADEDTEDFKKGDALIQIDVYNAAEDKWLHNDNDHILMYQEIVYPDVPLEVLEFVSDNFTGTVYNVMQTFSTISSKPTAPTKQQKEPKNSNGILYDRYNK